MMRVALAAIAALAVTTPALAAPVATTSIAVSPAGLDLASAAGASAMADRIDQAALRACGASGFSVRDLQAEVRRSDCYRSAVGQAETALNAPAVSAALRASPPAGS